MNDFVCLNNYVLGAKRPLILLLDGWGIDFGFKHMKIVMNELFVTYWLILYRLITIKISLNY